MVMAVEDSMLRVVVRLRPPTPKELESQRRPVVQVVDERVLVFDPEEPDGGFLGLKWGSAQDGPRKKGKDLTFVFDRVFGETATQQDVFQHTTHSILDSFLQGYNCSGEPACPSAGHQMRKALALPSLWAPHSVFSGVGATLLGPGVQYVRQRGFLPSGCLQSRAGRRHVAKSHLQVCAYQLSYMK